MSQNGHQAMLQVLAMGGAWKTQGMDVRVMGL